MKKNSRIYYAGNKGKLNFNLRDYSTKAEVLAAVDRIEYRGENTNTTGGLKVARLEVFDQNYEERPDVDRIMVLITDGVPTYDADKLDDEVAAVKNRSIRIVGLGVTNKVTVYSVSISSLQAACFFHFLFTVFNIPFLSRWREGD